MVLLTTSIREAVIQGYSYKKFLYSSLHNVAGLRFQYPHDY